jgi:hypothetical protein
MIDTPEREPNEGQRRQPPTRPRQSVIIRIFGALKRHKNRTRRRREKEQTPHQINERMMALWTRHVGWFTGALVVVSIVTAVIFWHQLDVMKGQLAEMARAYDPIKESADAARDAVKLADRTAERQLRAYVGVTEPLIQNVGVNQVPNVTFRIRNYGRTPARKVRYWAEFEIGAYPLKMPLNMGEPAPQALIINPQDGFKPNLQRQAPLNGQQAINIQAGSERMYLWGIITYEDVFEHPRTTKFRMMYGGPQIIGSGNIMALAEEGSEAD